VTVHQIIDVVAMGNLWMTTVRTVNVPRFVAVALVIGRASVGIRSAHFQHALVDVIPVGMVQVAVMHVINVAVMLDGNVAAIGAMRVLMTFHFLTGIHIAFSYSLVGRNWQSSSSYHTS